MNHPRVRPVIQCPVRTTALTIGTEERLTGTIARPSPLVAKLAALLAKGFLRLTQTAHNPGTFRTGEPQKELDVSRAESPHCSEETGGHGGGQRDS